MPRHWPFVRLSAAVLAAACLSALPIHASGVTPSRYDEGEPGNFIAESMHLDSRILDTLAGRLGARAWLRSEKGFCYERRNLGLSVYNYCLWAEWTSARQDTAFADTTDWSLDTVSLRKDSRFGSYSFDVVPWQGSFEHGDNLAAFLRSAYLQQQFPAYRLRDSLFMPMPTQTQLGLWMRGAVSPVWARRYAYRGDPFSRSDRYGRLPAYGYILDGGFAVIILAAVASMIANDHPETAAEKLLLFAACRSVASLGLFLPVLSFDLGESIRIRKSGYRFPRTLKID